MDTRERPASRALDELLVVECQLGNAEAFRALVRRWNGAFVQRAETLTRDREAARDVAQESWIGIIRGLRGLRDPGRFPAWVMSIVANKSRDWVRREQSRRRAIARAGSDEPSDVVSDGARDRVRGGLATLEPAQRHILRRHYLESFSVAEIAAELGVPEGTVKSRLSTARDQLRLRIAEDSRRIG
jgi:RNA polymerase sigma-70 factor (ECF subfamily)